MAGMYGVSQVSEIIPNLYLTSVYGATKENILKKGTTLLVNAAQELPKQEMSGLESIKLFLDDTPYATISVYFDRIADKIHEHLTRGGRVMVHCVLGVSRSTSLVLAYLMKYKNMSLKNALELVSSKRPCVRPNPGFWKQLVEYEKNLLSGSYKNFKVNPERTTSDRYGSGNSSTMTTSYSNRTDREIPIQIVHSSVNGSQSPLSSLSASRFLAPASSSILASSSSPYLTNYSNTTAIPVQNDYNSGRPVSATRYGSSTLYDRNINNYISSKSTDRYNSNGYTSSSSYAPAYVAPQSSHRTGFVLNDDALTSYKKPSPFSTTYRTSYGRF